MSIIKNEDKKLSFKIPFPKNQKFILEQSLTPVNYSDSRHHHSRLYNYEINDIAKTFFLLFYLKS